MLLPDIIEQVNLKNHFGGSTAINGLTLLNHHTHTHTLLRFVFLLCFLVSTTTVTSSLIILFLVTPVQSFLTLTVLSVLLFQLTAHVLLHLSFIRMNNFSHHPCPITHYSFQTLIKPSSVTYYPFIFYHMSPTVFHHKVSYLTISSITSFT